MKKSDKQFEYIHDLTPFSEMCINCVYFVQHYVHYRREIYAAIDDGHCRHGSLKRCCVWDYCGRFVNKYYDDAP